MKQVYAPGCALLIYKPHLAAKVLAHLDGRDRRARRAPDLLPPRARTRTRDARHQHLSRLRPALSRALRRHLDDLALGTARRERPLPLPRLPRRPDGDPGRLPDAHRDARARRGAPAAPADERDASSSRGPRATESICCGDSFHGELPDERVKQLMAKRADAMPADDVVVYCVSCVKAMHIGGKRPRYLVDLLFAEETHAGIFEPAAWHAMLDEFIAAH